MVFVDSKPSFSRQPYPARLKTTKVILPRTFQGREPRVGRSENNPNQLICFRRSAARAASRRHGERLDRAHAYSVLSHSHSRDGLGHRGRRSGDTSRWCGSRKGATGNQWPETLYQGRRIGEAPDWASASAILGYADRQRRLYLCTTWRESI